MNDQRQVIFAQRKEIMQTDNVHETVLSMRAETIDTIVADAIPEGSFADKWDGDLLRNQAATYLAVDVPGPDWVAEDGIAEPEIIDRLQDMADKHMAAKALRFGPETMRMAEKSLLLQVLDQQWKEHLLQLDQLRQGIGLRAYAQKDPLNEYKKEAFHMFEGMLGQMRQTVTMALAHVELRPPEEATSDAAPEAVTGAASGVASGVASGAAPSGPADSGSAATAMPSGKVPRNAPCPCGSGKKYKHCHGRLQ
jgi:preprotein translocase subunit SecA